MRRLMILTLCLLLAITTVGCAIEAGQMDVIEIAASADRYSPKLVDNPLLYENDRGDTVRVFFMTITPNNLSNHPPVLWDNMNSVLLTMDNFEQLPEFKAQKVDVILQEGTEKGPQEGMFGYGKKHPNAVVNLRGQSAIAVPQKSYKIKLAASEEYWNGQKTINLMKHQKDLSRMRNKLSFDYFTLIPDLISFRTQFVHLYVKDLTKNPPDTQFVDYGLYTQIEQPNKLALRSHGLDPNGHLYKANFFEFYRYVDELKLKSDPTYDEEVFNSVLEIQGNEDHAKLLKMLDDINNYDLDIDEVFDQHFDRDNFFTWLAVTILFNNHDTNSQNFYLYSPLNSEKWFIIPWDYDKGWEMDSDQGWDLPNERYKIGLNWEFGLSNYWGMVLPKRLFKNPKNVEQLNQMIRELLRIITPEQTQAFIDQYSKVVRPYISRQPDIAYLPGTLDQFEEMIERYVHLPDLVAEYYFAALEKPMPFYMGDAWEDGNKLVFEWDYSYDLQGDDLLYHLQVAKDPYFETIVTDIDQITLNYHLLDMLPAGKYYWRIIARDHKGNEMGSFDDYADEDGTEFRGIREFWVD